MKICVAVPVYEGRLLIQTAQALMTEQLLAVLDGDTFQVQFVAGNAGIVQARNQMAYEFMRGEFERIVFLDADVTWEPGALLKLAHKPADVVAGCYRFKLQEEQYPVNFLSDPDGKGLWANGDGLIEVEAVATGFLAISRSALQKFEDAFPERMRTHFTQPTFSYFQMPVHEGIFTGEDYWFCHEWRALGGKVYIDPEITLTHWNTNPVAFKGHLGTWLKSRAQAEASA